MSKDMNRWYGHEMFLCRVHVLLQRTLIKLNNQIQAELPHHKELKEWAKLKGTMEGTLSALGAALETIDLIRREHAKRHEVPILTGEKKMEEDWGEDWKEAEEREGLAEKPAEAYMVGHTEVRRIPGFKQKVRHGMGLCCDLANKLKDDGHEQYDDMLKDIWLLFESMRDDAKKTEADWKKHRETVAKINEYFRKKEEEE